MPHWLLTLLPLSYLSDGQSHSQWGSGVFETLPFPQTIALSNTCPTPPQKSVLTNSSPLVRLWDTS